MTRLLGIDPGLNLTGYACVELASGATDPRLIEAGVIRLERGASMPQRLLQLHEDLDSILDELQPAKVVVESLFSHKSYQRASLLMGHARGVVLLAATRRGISTDELAPAEVKRALTGSGRASKHQMQQAVMAQCGLPAPPEPPDVADAIAIALCAGRRESSPLTEC